MRFIVATLGSAGDVFPFLGLAVELQGRGHEITFATNAHFEALIRRHGLNFEALGSEEDYQATISNPDLWNPRKAFPHIFRFVSPVLRRQYDIIAAAGPDAVSITNFFGFGALLAQEKLGIPAVTVHLQPSALWSRINPPTLPGVIGPRWFKNFMYNLGERFVIDAAVCPFLNNWRAELKLPPGRLTTRWWHSPFCVLCLFPDWFCPIEPDWPANVIQTTFPLWNDGSADSLPATLEAFLAAGPPPIVFTPGTANVHAREFFQTAVEACRQLDRRAIFLTQYPDQLPASLPVTIHAEHYAPLDRVLPRSAAFVHHGGIGSTSQALLAGIPQVLMPLAHDQFDNAVRIEKLGAGAGIPAVRFTVRALKVTLNRLLASERVANSCREAAAKLEPRDGIRRSADAILNRVAAPAAATA